MRPERQIRGKVVFQAGHSMAKGQSLGGEGEAEVARPMGQQPNILPHSPCQPKMPESRRVLLLAQAQLQQQRVQGESTRRQSMERQDRETVPGERVRGESTGREYGEKVPEERVQRESMGREYQERKYREREYQERVPGKSTGREYQERVQGERVPGERVPGEREYQEREYGEREYGREYQEREYQERVPGVREYQYTWLAQPWCPGLRQGPALWG